VGRGRVDKINNRHKHKFLLLFGEITVLQSNIVEKFHLYAETFARGDLADISYF